MAALSKNYKSVNENERLINELPDDIVISSILSRLTFNEVARSRLVSRHWNRSWYHNPILNFENSSSMDNIRFNMDLLEHERWSFVNWVNHVLANHLGFSIDQFKVTFDLDNTYQYDIDTWVVWALSKHVKKFELDFSPIMICSRDDSEHYRYALHQPLLEKVKPVLTCLCLKRVNVTTQAVEQLLESCCSTLENLCIEKSLPLTSIRTTTSLQCLKYFKVYGCKNLKTIDICAPKLLSFTYQLCGFKLLRIGNASSLSQVWIKMRKEDRVVHAISSLSSYFSQLEYLKLAWFLHPEMATTMINSPRVLANLKHLELSVFGHYDQSIAGWISFIEACPLLQRLTLEICCPGLVMFGNVVNDGWGRHLLSTRERHPLRCLKTLEIMGFVGGNVDLDVANYVLENGVALQELILQPFSFSDQPKRKVSKRALSDLKIPPGLIQNGSSVSNTASDCGSVVENGLQQCSSTQNHTWSIMQDGCSLCSTNFILFSKP